MRSEIESKFFYKAKLPEKNFSHLFVNHKINWTDPANPGVHTNNIERMNRSLKCKLFKQASFSSLRIKRGGKTTERLEEAVNTFMLL